MSIGIKFRQILNTLCKLINGGMLIFYAALILIFSMLLRYKITIQSAQPYVWIFILLFVLRILRLFYRRKVIEFFEEEIGLLFNWRFKFIRKPYIPKCMENVINEFRLICNNWQYKPKGDWDVYIKFDKNDILEAKGILFTKRKALFISANLVDNLDRQVLDTSLKSVLSREFSPWLNPAIVF